MARTVTLRISTGKPFPEWCDRCLVTHMWVRIYHADRPAAPPLMCQPTPVYTSPQGEVSIEFTKGDHDAALAALERAVEDVKAQIAESHAPTWDGPRKVGEEEMREWAETSIAAGFDLWLGEERT